MNRFALAILTLAIALGGPASAQTFYRVAPEFQTPHVVGGEVSLGGKISWNWFYSPQNCDRRI